MAFNNIGIQRYQMWRFLAKSFFGGGKLQNFRHTSQISSLIIVQTTFYQTFTYFLTRLGPKKQHLRDIVVFFEYNDW